MIEQLERELYLTTDTKIFALVELADWDSQRSFRHIKPEWNAHGYELLKNEIPPDYKFDNGTYKFTLNFSEDLDLAPKAFYYGMVNVLSKARYVNRPSLIINCNSFLNKPIDNEFVKRVDLFNTLSIRNKAKDGLIVTQQGARLLVDHFFDKELVLDKPFTEHYYQDILSKLKPNSMDENVSYIAIPNTY